MSLQARMVRYPRTDLWAYWGSRVGSLLLLVPVAALLNSGLWASPGFWVLVVVVLAALVAWLLWWLPAGVVVDGSRLGVYQLARQTPQRWADLSLVVGATARDRIDSTSNAVPTLTLWSRPPRQGDISASQRRVWRAACASLLDAQGGRPVASWSRGIGALQSMRLAVSVLSDDASAHVLNLLRQHDIKVIDQGAPAWAQRGTLDGEVFYPASDVSGRVGRAFGMLLLLLSSLVLIAASPGLLRAENLVGLGWLVLGCLVAIAAGLLLNIAMRRKGVLVGDAGTLGYRSLVTGRLRRLAVRDVVAVNQFKVSGPIGTQAGLALWLKSERPRGSVFLTSGLSEAGAQSIKATRAGCGPLRVRGLETSAIQSVGRAHIDRVLQAYSLPVVT